MAAHHVILIMLPVPPPSKRRTGEPYGVYGIWTWFLWTPHQCVAVYSTDPPTPSVLWITQLVWGTEELCLTSTTQLSWSGE